MGTWFGSSGIRGPYPATVNIDLALRLGCATGTLARRILVGHDVRLTSPTLTQALAAGALSAGAAVDLAGGAATPSLAYSARNYDLAVAVTASHNPPPDNGFKYWNPDGSAWAPAQEDELERLLGSGSPARAGWDRISPLGRGEATRPHAQAMLKFVGPLEGSIVLDCGNGAGSFVSPAVFRQAGLQVEPIFSDPDGRFPNRPSEPAPENLSALSARCRATGRWGIAHDGDADRMAAIDPGGAPVPPDVVMVALALMFRARRMATPVDASLALAAALPDVRWDYTRVGDAAVSAALKETHGDLGAETSGTYIVPAFDYAPDGPLAGLLLLKAARDGHVDEARRRLKPTHRVSTKIPLVGVDRAAVRRHLEGIEPKRGERATRVDGLRIDTDGGWFLVRPSGTEPIVRVTAEGWTAPAAQDLLGRGRQVVEGLPAR